jgi:hypothetical protein
LRDGKQDKRDAENVEGEEKLTAQDMTSRMVVEDLWEVVDDLRRDFDAT